MVRTAGIPTSLVGEVRKIVSEADEDLPLTDVRPMSDYLADARGQARFTLTLIFTFGGIALVLACVGLYGVVSYSVTQRTHEIGIRMALGAHRGNIFRQVVGHGLTMVGGGLLLGTGVAFVAVRGLQTLLFGVSPTDPLSFLVAAFLLSGVALTACILPARRATKVDPMVALRYE